MRLSYIIQMAMLARDIDADTCINDCEVILPTRSRHEPIFQAAAAAVEARHLPLTPGVRNVEILHVSCPLCGAGKSQPTPSCRVPYDILNDLCRDHVGLM